MKKTFFLLCALLLVLGTLLPIAGYRLTLAVFGPAQGASSAPLPGTAASEAAPDSAAVPPSDQDSESFCWPTRAPEPWSRCPGGNI